MKRLAVVLFAILIAAAAPARAWCEASCLSTARATTTSAKPHCPAHESPSDGAKISATDTSDCPTIEAARPVPATLLMLPVKLPSVAPRTLAPAFRTLTHSSTQAPRHPRSVPLRI